MDLAKQSSVGSKAVNAIGRAGPDAAIAVEPEAVEESIVAKRKLATAGQTISAHIKDTQLAWTVGLVGCAAVRNVEQALVFRERQAVRPHHIGHNRSDGSGLRI